MIFPIDTGAQGAAAGGGLGTAPGDEADTDGPSGTALAPFVIYLTVFFMVWSVRATIGYAVDMRIPAGFARGAYSNTVKYALWVLPLVPYLRLVDGVDPLRYLRLRAPLSAAAVRRSMAAIALFLLVGVAGAGLRGQPVDALLDTSPEQWLTALLAVLVSPLAEEILFRGFVLRKLVERLHFVTANLLSALLFSAAHWPYWLWYHGVSYTLHGGVPVLLIGLFLGYLVHRTGSLWPAVVAHIANNLVAAIITA